MNSCIMPRCGLVPMPGSSYCDIHRYSHAPQPQPQHNEDEIIVPSEDDVDEELLTSAFTLVRQTCCARRRRLATSHPRPSTWAYQLHDPGAGPRLWYNTTGRSDTMSFTTINLANDQVLVEGTDIRGNSGSVVLDGTEWNAMQAQPGSTVRSSSTSRSRRSSRRWSRRRSRSPRPTR